MTWKRTVQSQICTDQSSYVRLVRKTFKKLKGRSGASQVFCEEQFLNSHSSNYWNTQFLLLLLCHKKSGLLFLLLYFSKHGQLDLFEGSDSISDHLISIFPERLPARSQGPEGPLDFYHAIFQTWKGCCFYVVAALWVDPWQKHSSNTWDQVFCWTGRWLM